MVVIVSKAQRYLSTNRAMLKSKTRVPWRYRTKQKALAKSLTPVEKNERAKQRKERNDKVNSVLNNALEDVWKLAEKIFEELGSHSVRYWYERLLQRSGKKKYTRKTSRWNAFLSLETKRRNAGE
jgi:hypothetical protein